MGKLLNVLSQHRRESFLSYVLISSSIMNHFMLILSNLLLVLCIGPAVSLPDREKRQANTVTETVTESKTTTLILTVSVNQVCAQLVNVTGSCRRRRGIIASEAPVVMILDEGLEDVEEYFNPSAPLSVETTAKMMVPKQLDLNQHGSLPLTPQVQSSKENVAILPTREESVVLPRIFFNQIAELFSSLFGVTTVTTIISEFSTSSIVSTGTFFLSRCTPSPFLY